MIAAIAIAVGVRADIWQIDVPSWMREVCEPHHASGVERVGAVRLGRPRRVVAEPLGFGEQLGTPTGGPAPQYPIMNPRSSCFVMGAEASGERRSVQAVASHAGESGHERVDVIGRGRSVRGPGCAEAARAARHHRGTRLTGLSGCRPRSSRGISSMSSTTSKPSSCSRKRRPCRAASSRSAPPARSRVHQPSRPYPCTDTT